MDLCLKIREQKRKIVYQPQSVLYHLESRTPGRKAHDLDNSRRLTNDGERPGGSRMKICSTSRMGMPCPPISRMTKLGYRLRLIDDPTTRRERAFVAEVQSGAHGRI